MENSMCQSVVKFGVELSVVVCTFNRAELLQDCLQSLVEQTLAKDRYEILVVDNNSADNTAELVNDFSQRYRNICYLFEKNQGLSFARNHGWSEAKGEYVAYLDDDATAAPDWCEKIIGAFVSVRPSPVAVGGPILPRLRCTPPWWFSPRLETRTWGQTAHFLRTPLMQFGFSGSNMAFKKEVLITHGGFNTDFGMCGDQIGLGEETDLFSRIHARHPLFWYDPNIGVHHLVSNRQLKLRCRIYRAFQAGRSRRKIEQTRFSLKVVMKETIGVAHSLIELLNDRNFNMMYIIVSLLERTANRVGYVSTSG
jgi:glycosyltransferase involved in cell wall biosynthesis